MKKAKAKGMNQQEFNAIANFIMVTFHQNTGRAKGKPGMLEVYIAPIDEVLTMPEPGSTYTAPGDTATTADPIVMVDATDGGFIALHNDLYKGSKLVWTSEGDITSPSDKAVITCRVNGFNAELVERYRDLEGVPLAVIIKDNTCPVDTYVVIGCKCASAYIKHSFDSDEVGGSNGKRFDLTIEANCAPFFWTGTPLPLKTPTV